MSSTLSPQDIAGVRAKYAKLKAQGLMRTDPHVAAWGHRVRARGLVDDPSQGGKYVVDPTTGKPLVERGRMVVAPPMRPAGGADLTPEESAYFNRKFGGSARAADAAPQVKLHGTGAVREPGLGIAAPEYGTPAWWFYNAPRSAANAAGGMIEFAVKTPFEVGKLAYLGERVNSSRQAQDWESHRKYEREYFEQLGILGQTARGLVPFLHPIEEGVRAGRKDGLAAGLSAAGKTLAKDAYDDPAGTLMQGLAVLGIAHGAKGMTSRQFAGAAERMGALAQEAMVKGDYARAAKYQRYRQSLEHAAAGGRKAYEARVAKDKTVREAFDPRRPGPRNRVYTVDPNVTARSPVVNPKRPQPVASPAPVPAPPVAASTPVVYRNPNALLPSANLAARGAAALRRAVEAGRKADAERAAGATPEVGKDMNVSWLTTTPEAMYLLRAAGLPDNYYTDTSLAPPTFGAMSPEQRAAASAALRRPDLRLTASSDHPVYYNSRRVLLRNPDGTVSEVLIDAGPGYGGLGQDQVRVYDNRGRFQVVPADRLVLGREGRTSFSDAKEAVINEPSGPPPPPDPLAVRAGELIALENQAMADLKAAQRAGDTAASSRAQAALERIRAEQDAIYPQLWPHYPGW